MSSVSTPNYVLTSAVQVYSAKYGTKELPAGAFVRPIELVYVPKHIQEDNDKHFNPETHVYCYTHYGIFPFKRDDMRRV